MNVFNKLGTWVIPPILEIFYSIYHVTKSLTSVFLTETNNHRYCCQVSIPATNRIDLSKPLKKSSFLAVADQNSFEYHTRNRLLYARPNNQPINQLESIIWESSFLNLQQTIVDMPQEVLKKPQIMIAARERGRP